MQYFSVHTPELSAIHNIMLWETAEETWQQNSALIVAVKCCGTFIITGKSVYASKAKKSDQLTGGFEFYLN